MQTTTILKFHYKKITKCHLQAEMTINHFRDGFQELFKYGIWHNAYHYDDLKAFRCLEDCKYEHLNHQYGDLVFHYCVRCEQLKQKDPDKDKNKVKIIYPLNALGRMVAVFIFYKSWLYEDYGEIKQNLAVNSSYYLINSSQEIHPLLTENKITTAPLHLWRPPQGMKLNHKYFWLGIQIKGVTTWKLSLQPSKQPRILCLYAVMKENLKIPVLKTHKVLRYYQQQHRIIKSLHVFYEKD